jgi:hypothetical protein
MVAQDDGHNDEDILSRLSFGILTRFSVCASRFKRRKKLEADKLLAASTQRLATASSMYSRITKDSSKKPRSSAGVDGETTVMGGGEAGARGAHHERGGTKGLVTAGFRTLTGMKDIFKRKKEKQQVDDEF